MSKKQALPDEIVGKTIEAYIAYGGYDFIMIFTDGTGVAGEIVHKPYVYTRGEMYLDLFTDWCLCRDTEALRKEAQEANK